MITTTSASHLNYDFSNYIQQYLYINYIFFLLQVEGYWDECLALPSKLKDKDAYNDLKTSLQTYLEVFPLLKALNSKVTIVSIYVTLKSCIQCLNTKGPAHRKTQQSMVFV